MYTIHNLHPIHLRCRFESCFQHKMSRSILVHGCWSHRGSRWWHSQWLWKAGRSWSDCWPFCCRFPHVSSLRRFRLTWWWIESYEKKLDICTFPFKLDFLKATDMILSHGVSSRVGWTDRFHPHVFKQRSDKYRSCRGYWKLLISCHQMAAM